MEDPIFDPWSPEAEEAPTPTAPRWRAPAGPAPMPSRPPVDATPAPALATTQTRLPGTPGFLRTMAVPRLEAIARRLHMSRHRVSLEDALDQTPPVVRLRFRPWRGPLPDAPDPSEGTLELGIEEGPDEGIVVQAWIGSPSGAPGQLARTPAAKFGAAWLEARTLDFVRAVLGRA